ncbi:MAG: formylglycine-generating enzyme family protein [Oscillochloris sp.]|nr:formylglycine-generating enzyme family protein [Oscillochloris sp.]
MTHTLFDEVLAFTPALADVNPGKSLQTYTVDGYGGLNRSGSLDAILPSEWALPSELISYRFLNGELLYYGHERPPERRTSLLLLLVQLGDAMAGDLELLAKAGALALGRSALGHGMAVQLICFDATLHPPQSLARPAEVAKLVRQTGQGIVNLLAVLEQVQAHVHVQASTYTQIEIIWLLHAQSGSEQADTLGIWSRQLHTYAHSRALFVSAGAAIPQPALAGQLAEQWASIGSTALYDADERARATRALRDLATPRRNTRRAQEVPQPQRRVVKRGSPPSDPAQPLLAKGQWDKALDLLEPRTRAGDATAKLLLVALIEGVTLPPQEMEAEQQKNEGQSNLLPPLSLRLHAAGLLGTIGDPRLLDPRTGNSTRGTYWCQIPAGRFWFGDEQQGEAREQSLPYAFQIARYPVTNTEYRRFIEAGGYQQRKWWTAQGWPYLQASENRFKSNGRQITHPWYWFDPEYNQPGQPVVGISWWEAAAYCAWLSAQGQAAGWLTNTAVIRLPTSLEWERAARGDTRQRYPWGDAIPDAERANYEETRIGRPTPVGCFPRGAAPSGAQDMAGNIMEWLASSDDDPGQINPLYDAEPEAIVLLSHAAFDDDNTALRCGARIESGPFARYLDRGFRIVMIGER